MCNYLNLVHPPYFHQYLPPHCCLSVVNSLKRWHVVVLLVLETAFAQSTYICAFLYLAVQTSSAFASEVPLRSSP